MEVGYAAAVKITIFVEGINAIDAKSKNQLMISRASLSIYCANKPKE